MKQANIHGPGEVRLDEVDVPEPGPRDAVVRVAACGICGSDLRYVRQGGLMGPTDRAMPIGHELSGTVESVGAELQGLAPGTRVVLNPMAAGHMIGNGGTEGGFAPYLLVRGAADGGSLFPIPDDLPDDVAALAEPLGVGMNAVDKLGAAPGEKIVVFGAGPIGLTAIATLADRGVDDVVAIDLSEHRLEVARRLGARATIDAGNEDVWQRLRELHGESSVLGMPMVASDGYIEASGVSALIPQIIQHARGHARVSVVAIHGDDVPVSFLTVMYKQLTLRGAMEYPEDYREVIALLTRRDLSPMISHRFALEDFAEALATAQNPHVAAKVIVQN